MSPRKRYYPRESLKRQAEMDLHPRYLRWHPVRHGRRARERKREAVREAALVRIVRAQSERPS